MARQAQRAREFAKQKGWAFDERYVFSDDGVSGAEFKNRPGLNKLLEAVKGKQMNKARMQMDWLRYWTLQAKNERSTKAPLTKQTTYTKSCLGQHADD